MAVTRSELAALLGIAVADATDDTDAGIVEAGRLLTLAGALVDAYLRDPDDTLECPAVVRDEAVIRTAGYVQNRGGVRSRSWPAESRRRADRRATGRTVRRPSVRRRGATVAVGAEDGMMAPAGVLIGECADCYTVERCYRDQHGTARCLACVHHRWSGSKST